MNGIKMGATTHKIWASYMIIGLGLFRHLTFWQETFRHGHFITFFFGTGTLQLCGHTSKWTLCLQGHLGYYSTGTFQHRYISVQCQNVLVLCIVLKYSSVVTYPRRNVPWWKVPVYTSSSAKMSPCRKIHVSKNTRAEKSPCQNVHGDEMFICS